MGNAQLLREKSDILIRAQTVPIWRDAMAGAIIGLLCGGLELYLLMRVVQAIAEPKPRVSVGVLVLAKVAVLVAAFAAAVLFFRSEILYCGVGITVVLIVGSVILFARNNAKLRKIEEENKQKENNEGGNGDHA